MTHPTTTTRRTPAPTSRGAAPLLTISEVAQRLGVEVRHIRRLVHERRIPFIKWGHLLRFDPADIDMWLDDNRHPPAPSRHR